MVVGTLIRAVTCELLEVVDIELTQKARVFLSCRAVLGHDDLFEEGCVFDDEGSSVWLPGDDVGVTIVLSFIYQAMEFHGERFFG